MVVTESERKNTERFPEDMSNRWMSCGEANERILCIENISRLFVDLTIGAENLGLERIGVVSRLEVTMLFRTVDVSKGLHNCTEREKKLWNGMGYTYFVCNLTFDVL